MKSDATLRLPQPPAHIESLLLAPRMEPRLSMELTTDVLRTLDEVLSLKGRALDLTRQSQLLGAIPELDSMAVVSLITRLEERFGIVVDDDDIDGSVFETVGSLVDFVGGKVAA